jgi:hypothetical protein
MQNNNTNYVSIVALDLSGNAKLAAEKAFLAYKAKGVIRTGAFEDDKWFLTDEYSQVGFNFRKIDEAKYRQGGWEETLGVKPKQFVEYLKIFIIQLLGELSLATLREIINHISQLVKTPLNELSTTYIYLVLTGSRIMDFFGLIGEVNDKVAVQPVIDTLDDIIERQRIQSPAPGKRELAAFDSYFEFNDLIDRFMKETTDLEERLFFFPIWLWWKVTAVIPTRPKEFIVTPYNCLSKNGNEWVLTLMADKMKGAKKRKAYKIKEDFDEKHIVIPNNIAEMIEWYKQETRDYPRNELNTLFITDVHYAKWDRCTPINSRYYTYINLSTCLRYFYRDIIIGRYGYEVIEDKRLSYIEPGQIQYIDLGDARHLAMINIIAEGASPYIAQKLAGQSNPEMAAHYFTNLSKFLECKTHRYYKAAIQGDKSYAISFPAEQLQVGEFKLLDDPKGRCYSPEFVKNSTKDCENVIGPAGEIGFCKECRYYRQEDMPFTNGDDLFKNRIDAKIDYLSKIVKDYRRDRCEMEDIDQALEQLQAEAHSYQEYLMEKEMQLGKENTDGKK